MTLTQKKLKPSKVAEKYRIDVKGLKKIISNAIDNNKTPEDICDPEHSNKTGTIEAVAFPKSVLDELCRQCKEDQYLVVIPIRDTCVQDEGNAYHTMTPFRSVALSIWAHPWISNVEKPENLVPDCLEGAPIFSGGTPIPPPPPPPLT